MYLINGQKQNWFLLALVVKRLLRLLQRPLVDRCGERALHPILHILNIKSISKIKDTNQMGRTYLHGVGAGCAEHAEQTQAQVLHVFEGIFPRLQWRMYLFQHLKKIAIHIDLFEVFYFVIITKLIV